MLTIYITVFLLKLVDCILTTFKTKALIHGYDKLASILKGIASITYATILVKIVKSNTTLGIIVIGLAETLGTFLATSLFNRFKKDDEWTLFVVPKTRELSIEISQILRSCNISTYAIEGYYNKESVLSYIVVTNTKKESKIVFNTCKGKASCKVI